MKNEKIQIFHSRNGGNLCAAKLSEKAKAIFAAVLLAVLPVNAFAADAEGNYAAIGAGYDRCDKIAKEDGESATSDVNKQLNHQWLVGYITAANVWYYHGQNVAAGMDFNELYTWALKYCKENPLKPWAHAAKELVIYLKNRR